MRTPVRIFVYVVLIVCALVFGRVFYKLYTDVDRNAVGTTLATGGIFLVTTIILSLIAAHDLSQLVAGFTEQFFYRNLQEDISDPEYDRAEQAWADGDYLEAVRLMREFLVKNPREQHVALRIAEIYEKDLNNHLAAALEYEEVLKHPLPHERWGWAAIHLANLYTGKLNRTEDALQLLHRIAEEYSETAAAKKARERLGIPEPEPADEEELSEGEENPSDAQPPPASNLPPGFRPKKR